MLFVLQRVFYALEDTRTPFLIQVVQAVLYVAGAILIGLFVPVPWIAVALALALSVAGTVQTVVAIVLLRRKLHGLAVAPVVLRGLIFLGAALVAALAGVGVLAALGGIGPESFAVAGRIQGVPVGRGSGDGDARRVRRRALGREGARAAARSPRPSSGGSAPDKWNSARLGCVVPRGRRNQCAR